MAFGTVPKGVWADWLRPDHDNQVDLESRALLVQQGDQNILVLAGCDTLLAPLPRTCRCQKHTRSLLDSLARLGLAEGDIDLVLLTHLQAMPGPELRAAISEGDTPRLLFPNARYLISERHWHRALRPHPLDRELFVRQIVLRLKASDRVELVGGGPCPQLGNGWHLHVSDGHTPGQLLPEIHAVGGPVVFAGDLVPGIHWLALEVASGFDCNPQRLVDEKEQLLDYIVANKGRLVLARDPRAAMIRVARDRQARYQPFDEHSELRQMEM